MKKKVLALFLSLLLVLTMIPTDIRAEENGDSYSAVSVKPKEAEITDVEDITYQELADVSSAVQSGKVESQFSGVGAYFYQALANTKFTSTSNGVHVSYNFKSKDEVITSSELTDLYYPIMMYYYLTHLENFNWVTNQCGIRNYSADSTGCDFTAYYVSSPYYNAEMDQQINQVVSGVLTKMTATTRYDQLKYIFEWICNYGTYDYASLESGVSEEKKYYAHSQVGILLKKTGVCESYAKTFAIFCQRLNIPCLPIYGNGHEWDYVQMEDGKWYMVDATWADQDHSTPYINYNYFLASNLPAQDLSHTADMGITMPNTSMFAYDKSGTHSYKEVINREAGCETTGLVTGTCSICGDIKTKTLPATGHVFVVTRDENGEFVKSCKNCTGPFSTITNCSHNWKTLDDEFNADYTIYTVNTYCSSCGKVDSNSAEIQNRSYTPATCGKLGSISGEVTITIKDGSSTTTRNSIFTKPVPKDPNNHTGGTVLLNKKDATEYADGYTGDTCCASCKAVFEKGQIIPALGHTHVYKSTVVNPTCTIKGYTAHTCTGCGDYYTDQEKPALGHSYGTATIIKEATCSVTGEKVSYCVRCNAKKAETIAKDASVHKHQAIVNDKTATLKEEGYTGDKICTDCGKVLEKGTVIEKKVCNHTWEKLAEYTIAPTCEKDGKEVIRCTYCSLVQENTVKKLGHQFDGKIEADRYKRSEPTCTSYGKYYYSCSRTGCGKAGTNTFDGSYKLEHVIVSTLTPADSNACTVGSIHNQCKTCTLQSNVIIPYAEKVKLSATKATYKGSAIKPTVTVLDTAGKTVDAKYYTVAYASNTNVGKADVTVTLKDNYCGTLTATFVINPKGTSISKLTAAKKAFTAKWSKVTTQTTGYELQYSTSASFSGAKTVTITKNSTVSKKISKLKAKKKYYVRARTYKTVGKVKYYSSWSSAKSVKTK